MQQEIGNNIHYGKVLRGIVELSGYSKKEVARRSNISEQMLHRIFKKKSLNTHLIHDISKVCNRKVIITIK